MKKLIPAVLFLFILAGCAHTAPVVSRPAPAAPAPSSTPTLPSPAVSSPSAVSGVSAAPAAPSPSDIRINYFDTGSSGGTERGLSISGKSISSSDFITGYGDIVEIEFNRCTIAEGVLLPHIESLKRVTFSNCNAEAPLTVKNNTQITLLELSSGMSDLSILSQLPQLTSLYLTGNDIKDLTPVSVCTDLDTLYLFDGNYELTTLKPLFGLKKLRHLGMGLKTFKNIVPEDLEYYGADPEFNTNRLGIIEID